MKKFVTFLILVVIILGGLYGGLWFYRAKVTKEYIEAQAEALKQNGGGEMTYEGLEVKGFPFDFRVVIDALHIETKPTLTHTHPMVVEIPQMVVDSNIQGDKYTIAYDNLTLQQEGSDYRTVLHVPSTQASVTFLRSAWKDVLDGSLDFDSPVSYTYQDKGFTMADREATPEQPLAFGGPTIVAFLQTNGQEQETFDIKVSTSVSPAEALAEAFSFKKLSLDFDALMKQPSGSSKAQDNRSIDIRKFVLAVDDVNIGLSGALQSAENDPQPVGKLLLDITNYTKLFDAFQGVDKTADKDVLTALLQKIAGTMDKTKVTIAVSREVGNEVLVGKMKLSEVIADYQDAMKKKLEEEQSATTDDTKEDKPAEE